MYMELLDRKSVFWPVDNETKFSVYHNFVIQVDDRDALKEFLFNRGVQSAIHYLKPIHLQPAAEEFGFKLGDFPVAEKQADRILSLPINQFLTRDQIEFSARTVNEFFA